MEVLYKYSRSDSNNSLFLASLCRHFFCNNKDLLTSASSILGTADTVGVGLLSLAESVQKK